MPLEKLEEWTKNFLEYLRDESVSPLDRIYEYGFRKRSLDCIKRIASVAGKNERWTLQATKHFGELWDSAKTNEGYYKDFQAAFYHFKRKTGKEISKEELGGQRKSILANIMEAAKQFENLTKAYGGK